MKDLFFFKDPYTGKRRPRLIFWATLVSVVLVVIAVAATVGFASHSPAALPPTPTPLPTATFTPTPAPTATFTPVPTVQGNSPRDKALAEIQACDPDPAHWKLVDQHMWKWQRLDTPCAVRGLERAVAWYLAVHSMGYTMDEATQALGLDKPAWAASKTWWTFFATAGKVGYAPLAITFGIRLRQWTVKNGKVGGVIIAPRGCYYTTNLHNGRMVSWKERYGVPFDMECYVEEYFTADYSVYQYAPTGRTGAEQEKRQFVFPVLFGYSKATKQWWFMGAINDNRLMRDIASKKYLPVLEKTTKDWGISLWTPQWASQTWGMPIRPLPANWQQKIGREYYVPLQQLLDRNVHNWVASNATYSVTPPKK